MADEDLEKEVAIHAERIRALEVGQENLIKRMDLFEQYCRQTQAIYRESFSDMNTRIERLLNHKVTELEKGISDAKHMQREPLSRQDWVKIGIAIISVTGTIIVALIQAGII